MKLSKPVQWAGFGIACYFVISLITLPASVVFDWFAPDDLAAAKVNGTLWSGEAASLNVKGIQIIDIEWSLKPLSLLTLKAGASVSAKVAGGRVEGDVYLPLFGKTGKARNLNAVIEIMALGEMLKQPLQVKGKAGVQIERLSWQGERIVEIVGNITLADLTELFDNNRLGTFDIQFPDDQGEQIKGLVSDSDAVFKLNGTIALDGQNSYIFDAVIEPTPQSPSKIIDALPYLGAVKDSQGKYTISYAGTL